MYTETAGTGTLTLISAVPGFNTFAEAGVPDGATITYAIYCGPHREIGAGVWTATTKELTRATVYSSTRAGNRISLSGRSEVFITPAKEDLLSFRLNDGDYGDIVISNQGQNINIDSAVATTFGRSLMDDADATGARTNLELGSIATQAANNVSITGGSITGITDLAVADGGTGASDASGARTNLGLAIGTDVQAYNATLAAVAGGTYTGDDSITTVGTISSGTWQGTAIANTYLPKLNGFTAPDGSVSLNDQTITNLADPTSEKHAANKRYVDNAFYLRDVTDSVRTVSITAGSPANVDISSAPAAIGGVTLSSGNRVLLTGQTRASQNGIYQFNGAGSAMTRTLDANSDAKVTPNMYVWDEEGNAGDTAWVLTTNGPITLGTTSLTFAKFSGLGQVTAGNGLTKTGDTIDVVSGNGGIVVNADNITLTLDGSTLSVGASGVKVADAGITSTQIASSVAGDGLTGGAGSALAVASANGGIVVNANDIALTLDGSTLSVGGSGLKVASAGITATELATSVVASGGGLTGGAGTGLSVRKVREAPSGSVNGSNDTFTLSQTPATDSLLLFRNGILQTGGGVDYTLSTATITFAAAPASGDTLQAWFLY